MLNLPFGGQDHHSFFDQLELQEVQLGAKMPPDIEESDPESSNVHPSHKSIAFAEIVNESLKKENKEQDDEIKSEKIFLVKLPNPPLDPNAAAAAAAAAADDSLD